MTRVLARVGAWLVVPAAGASAAAPPRATAAARVAPEIAVLAPADEVHGLAAGVALRLTRGPAVVALWARGTAGRTAAPAAPAARRLAALLDARGIPANAAGRLVTVALPEGEAESAATAERLAGLTGDAPVVLGVAGPRGDAWEQLLVDRDLVLVHAADDALADLTLARLTEQGADAIRLTTPPGALARALARAGLALPGGLDGLAVAGEAATR